MVKIKKTSTIIKKLSWYSKPYMVDYMPFNYVQDHYVGWFLFGWIPLWVRNEGVK